MQPPDSAFCHNCGVRLSGPFCAACGQKAVPLDIGVHDFVHDFAHEMLHVDGRIFQSVLRLLTWPGFLTREYLQGRRARWISPIRLYLLFSLLFFALSTAPVGNTVRIRASGVGEEQRAELQKLGFESVDDLRETLNHLILTWAPRAMFVLVPVFAALTLLVYRTIDRNFLHHLYFALHVHAAWFAAAAVAGALERLAPRGVVEALGPLFLLYALLYVFFALRTTYGGSVRRAIGAIAFAVPVYGLAISAAIIVIVFPVLRRLMEAGP